MWDGLETLLAHGVSPRMGVTESVVFRRETSLLRFKILRLHCTLIQSIVLRNIVNFPSIFLFYILTAIAWYSLTTTFLPCSWSLRIRHDMDVMNIAGKQCAQPIRKNDRLHATVKLFDTTGCYLLSTHYKRCATR